MTPVGGEESARNWRPGLPRRRLVAGLVAAGVAALRPTPASAAGPVVLGMSTSLEGPLSELGRPMYLGAKAHFDAVNATGGVLGRRIELIVRDDGYDARRSLENIKAFLANEQLFALFGCMGTPMVEAALPLLRGTDIPCFAPFTGATSVRSTGLQNVFPVRASFAQEAERITLHVTTIGYRRVAVVFQNNAYGREVRAAVEAALQANALAPAASLEVDADGANALAVAARMQASAPDAVVIGLAGKTLVEFVKGLRSRSIRLPLYSVSALSAPETLRALGDQSHGITVSQVMPSPGDVRLGVVREFQRIWKVSGAGVQASYPALEGYVSARAFTEALHSLGAGAARGDFVSRVWGTRRFDLGNFEIGFHRPGRGASQFIELTMVSAGGRFVR